MRVNFEVGTSGGASAEDALRTLNTELVAGKGPDVLILDGMPLQSFIDKGVLAELSQVISADGLIPQVVDPMRTDGKLYAVPTRFTVPVLMGKPETLEGLDSLEALAAAVQDGPEALAASGDINDIFKAVPEEQRPLLSFTTLRELFDQLYSVSAPAVVRDGTLNEAALRELFSVMQAVSDRYGLGKKANDGGIAFMVTSNASTGLGMSADVPQGVMEYSYGRANAALFTLKDVLGAYMSDDGQAALTPGARHGAGRIYTAGACRHYGTERPAGAGCTVHTGAARARRAELFVGRGTPGAALRPGKTGDVRAGALCRTRPDDRHGCAPGGLDCTAVRAEDTRAGRQHGGRKAVCTG